MKLRYALALMTLVVHGCLAGLTADPDGTESGVRAHCHSISGRSCKQLTAFILEITFGIIGGVAICVVVAFSAYLCYSSSRCVRFRETFRLYMEDVEGGLLDEDGEASLAPSKEETMEKSGAKREVEEEQQGTASKKQRLNSDELDPGLSAGVSEKPTTRFHKGFNFEDACKSFVPGEAAENGISASGPAKQSEEVPASDAGEKSASPEGGRSLEPPVSRGGDGRISEASLPTSPGERERAPSEAASPSGNLHSGTGSSLDGTKVSTPPNLADGSSLEDASDYFDQQKLEAAPDSSDGDATNEGLDYTAIGEEVSENDASGASNATASQVRVIVGSSSPSSVTSGGSATTGVSGSSSTASLPQDESRAGHSVAEEDSSP